MGKNTLLHYGASPEVFDDFAAGRRVAWNLAVELPRLLRASAGCPPWVCDNARHIVRTFPGTGNELFDAARALGLRVGQTRTDLAHAREGCL